MRNVLILIVAAVALFLCANCHAGPVSDEKTAKETITEKDMPLEEGPLGTDEGSGAPSNENQITGGGEEDWESYDEETGLPDVVESDHYGEVR